MDSLWGHNRYYALDAEGDHFCRISFSPSLLAAALQVSRLLPSPFVAVVQQRRPETVVLDVPQHILLFSWKCLQVQPSARKFLPFGRLWV